MCVCVCVYHQHKYGIRYWSIYAAIIIVVEGKY